MKVSRKMNVDERLARLEKLMMELITRIERLESILASTSDRESKEIMIASRLAISLSLPALRALEASRRLMELVSAKSSELDEISQSILEVLSTCNKYSISEITRKVRLIRGKASRRIIRERLKMLESRGYVVNIGTCDRPKYVLSSCLKGEKP